MKKIIEEYAKGQMYCYQCETLFSYQKEDVEEIRQYLNDEKTMFITLQSEISCPKCGHCIKVS